MKRPMHVLALAAAALAVNAAQAKIEITEWMYNGNADEFIELTNMGTAPVDFAGWRYDDSETPDASSGLDLSAFGTVAVGASVIISERSAALFRSAWNLGAAVKIIGGNADNLGRSDTIKIFDAGGALVDQLAFGDQNFPGTIRTQNFSGNPTSLAALAPQNVTADWALSAAGDVYGSYASLNGDVGNPGSFIFAPVPEPETYALMLAGLGLVAALARRRRAA
jgi:predicted extracellular nuclease